MAAESSNGTMQWARDVLKYVIGGTIAAGLVTFISFLIWRGGAEARFEESARSIVAIKDQVTKLDAKLDHWQEAALALRETALMDIAIIKRQQDINTARITKLEADEEGIKKDIREGQWKDMQLEQQKKK